MRLMRGDTVRHKGKGGERGIVERHSGSDVVVRWPDRENQREAVARDKVESLAEVIAQARSNQTKLTNALSLTGGSSIAELVEYFGYSTGQLRRDSLDRVANQLRRAGLVLRADDGDSFSREARFTFDRAEDEETGPSETAKDQQEIVEQSAALTTIALSQVGWPTAFGLDENRQVAFHRALMSREPLLCLLRLPPGGAPTLRPTWEALCAWAYQGAQRFIRAEYGDNASTVKTGDASLLETYLSATAISSDLPRLRHEPRSLNLISIASEQHLPVDFDRLQTLWPGGVYDFTLDSDSLTPARLEDLAKLLFVVGGRPDRAARPLPATASPLRIVLWAKEASEQLLGQSSAGVGRMLDEGNHKKFRGSTEGTLAVCLKAHVAAWAAAQAAKPKVRFELEKELEQVDAEGVFWKNQRTDVVVEGVGRFEAETLLGSGPIEVFLHQKLFSRVGSEPRLMLVLPTDALLWAAPWLLDAAQRLTGKAQLLVPADDSSLVAIEGQAFPEGVSAIDDPDARITTDLPSARGSTERVAAPIKLDDVRGYPTVKRQIDDKIVWPERNAKLLRGISRSPGILFFGPPGCGKSRWARAIAGELGQEARLLAPSDLRGEYVGWGQIRVREQFSWAADRERRMLVIDEIDAVARSRRSDGDMHSDEKATVNELLVQMDRVSQLGRIVVGTTNFIESLDEALLRSGRFGTFIPVPIPDLEASASILDYYLQRLVSANAGDNRVRVTVPSVGELTAVLKPLLDRNEADHRWLCGADLEAAVANSFTAKVREAVAPGMPAAAEVAVVMSAADIEAALASGPKSISQEAKLRFDEEKRRYCSE